MTKDTMKWGKDTASQRYGAVEPGGDRPSDELQKPQCPEDKHGPKYDNPTPNDWRRGMPSAEGKPGFDKHKAGR